MVRLIGIDLIANPPESGRSTTQRLRDVVENAQLFEELGFDGFGVGERHHTPFLSASPPVVLSHLAAHTERLRLFTGVTLLSVLDPVRVAEDYAVLDHLSNGRVELIIGKGNGPEQAELFGIGRTDAWDTLAENYALLRQIWDQEKVTWSPPAGVPSIRTAPLVDAVIHPKPLQRPIRVWHGSASTERSVELAARFGDPIFSANAQNPIHRYAELIDHYRAQWREHGHDPAAALVGAGHGPVVIATRREDAHEAYRPVYEAQAAAVARRDTALPGTRTDYASYADWLEQGSGLVGTVDDVVAKLRRYHAAFGHQVISVAGHPGLLDRDLWISSLKVLRDEVLPQLGIADPVWPEPAGVPVG